MEASTEQVRLIEELAANAWPAAVNQRVDGWLLRFTWGVSRRANSVWPNEDSGRCPLEEKMALVDDFYARHDQPSRYQICPASLPSDLDSILAERGYRLDARTSVQTAPIADVIVRLSAKPEYQVRILDDLDGLWFETYCRAERVGSHAEAVRRGILKRIGPRAGYALLEVKNDPVAIGLGVVERGWLGVFNITTRGDFRRHGGATAILNALAHWGQDQGATQAYLQVMEENLPAGALYTRAGFQALYTYHYREAP
jgi:N-acetylglutamate synthase